MNGVKEKINSCTCYGCIKKSSCKCSNCVLKKDCKTSFRLYKTTNKQHTNVMFAFPNLEILNIWRNIERKQIKKNEDLPKAKWIDLYMCGDFENDSEVKRMTKSKILLYKTTFKKVKNTMNKYE